MSEYDLYPLHCECTGFHEVDEVCFECGDR